MLGLVSQTYDCEAYINNFLRKSNVESNVEQYWMGKSKVKSKVKYYREQQI